MNTVRLIRRLSRLKAQKIRLEEEHVGNELNYTYWGGYDMGYIKGQISILEAVLDELGLLNDEE